jgi:hypothetical protein
MKIDSLADAPVSHTYKLLKPVETHGEILTALTFQDCTTGAWLVLDEFDGAAADQEAMILLTGQVSGTAAVVGVRRMSVRDYRAAKRAMEAFLNSRPVPPAGDETAVSITLAEPVQTEKGPVSTLELREPQARDLIAIDPLTGVKKDIAAIIACSGWQRDDVIKIPIRDFVAATGWVADFFDDAPATGA